MQPTKHILKSLALASKPTSPPKCSTSFWFVKKENNQRKLNHNFGFQLDDFFLTLSEISQKISVFFCRTLAKSCPWAWDFVVFFQSLALNLNIGSSTPPLLFNTGNTFNRTKYGSALDVYKSLDAITLWKAATDYKVSIRRDWQRCQVCSLS